MKLKSNQIYLILVFSQLSFGCSRAIFSPAQPKIINSRSASETNSKLAVPSQNVADGITPAQVTVSLRDSANEPVANVQLSLAVSGSENVIVPCGTTDANGLSSCRVYSTKAEMKTISVSTIFTLKGRTNFIAPNPMRSSFAFVSSASVQTLPSGHKIIAASGITESGNVGRDSLGAMRVYSSILGSMIGDGGH